MKIGVFDSGIGGKAIADAMRKEFPNAEVLETSDRKNLPYGSKTAEEITRLTDAAIQPLLNEQCDVIIIACNSATTAAISTLRERYPHQLFIGIEPMVKTAARMTKNGIVAVCATSATLASKRYTNLKSTYGPSLTYLEPDCNDWALLIESNKINRGHIDTIITSSIASNADVIVLGCTHYHWIKNEIEQLAAGKAVVLEPSQAIGRRIKELLKL